MRWSEVRNVYPSRFVLMEMLQSHEQDNVLFVDEVAIIRPLDDPREVMQELGKCGGDRFLYHTSKEQIAMQIRRHAGLRGRRSES